MNQPIISTCMLSSPIGDIKLFAHEDALLYVQFPESLPFKSELYLRRYYPHHQILPRDNAILQQTRMELLRYFDHPGQAHTFEVPIEFKGTEYQKKVWSCITQIPYGKVIRYGKLAEWCGDKKGCRSAGAGCGANPLSIVVPCHRILGSNRKLTGFGGGLAVKEWLLRHEGNRVTNHCYQGSFYEGEPESV
ncbi:MAG: methylated-DNA--[Clostridia bacterium]|nr:methylated-DNA--[protein]-cysteine S-methyltransferase [Clostridia bacterium]